MKHFWILTICVAVTGATGCGEERTEPTPAPFSSGAYVPEKFEFSASDGVIYSGTASIYANDAPGTAGAMLHIVARSSAGRFWSAQFTVGTADIAKGVATITLRPYAAKTNEGFVDDMSGPSPVFSEDGTARLTFKAGRLIELAVVTSNSSFAGTGGGKIGYECSVTRGTSEPSSPGVTELQPDPTLGSTFCSQFLRFQ